VNDAVEEQLVSHWPLSGLPTVLVAAGVVGLVVLWYARISHLSPWQRTLLGVLRGSVLALVLWMLAAWVLVRFATELPELLVMVDTSGSMATIDNSQATSRLAQAQSLIIDEQWWEDWESQYRPRLLKVGPQLDPVAIDSSAGIEGALGALQADGSASALGNAVMEVIQRQRGRPTAAMILFSDGINTVGERLEVAADEAARAGIPLYCVGIGSMETPPDVIVEDATSDAAVFVGELARVVVTLESSGVDASQIPVQLRDASGQVLAETNADGGRSSQRQTVELELLASEAGKMELEVFVPPLPGETSTQNNRQMIAIDVRDQSIRVLLLQQYPSYEFRFLKQMLERATVPGTDRKLVELTSFLAEGDPGYADQDQTAVRLPPVRSEELEKFDVIILGDCDPQQLGNVLLEQIARLVQDRGTGLVVMAGPRYVPIGLRGMPLESLLPVPIDAMVMPDPASLIGEGFAPQPSRGVAGGIPWPTDGQLPAMYWLLEAQAIRPTARVMLQSGSRAGRDGRPMPVVVTQFVGAGQVWLQLTDEMFRLGSFRGTASPHEAYWLHTIRTLARAKLLGATDQAELVVGGKRFAPGQSVPVRVRLLNPELIGSTDEVEVSIEQDGASPRSLRMNVDPARRGQFVGSIDNLAPGSYRVTLVKPPLESQPPSSTFVIQRPQGEQQRLAADLNVLRNAAEVSTGKYYNIEDASELIDDLPPGRRVRQQPLPPRPLWNHPLVPCLIVGLLASEWMLRRRWGLP
jgi:hypothetical protein